MTPLTVLKLPKKAYNAVFTPMGRKRLHYFVKRMRIQMNPDYRRTGTPVYQLKNGQRFVFHRGNQLSELLYMEGAYEPLESLIVSQAVRPGDVALDIGANVGYYTALLDHLVKPGGQVHSFEPGAGTFARLTETKTLLHLDQAVLHRQAVSDAVGHIDFWVSTTGFDGQQGTVRHHGLAEDVRCDRVEAVTLNSFLEELKTQGVSNIAFVKCDIEGAELAMLKSAQKVLSSADPPIWLIEHNLHVLRGYGATSLDLLGHFAGCDVYFSTAAWPPTTMVTSQATKWNGQPEQLPIECNLIIFPRRGVYAGRAEQVRKAGLIA